ncbi:hypothetical protein Tco_0445047 [Tanacetum coccineum]
MVAYLKKPTGSEGFQEIVDFLNGSHIRHLQLADADGISVLPTTEIFDQLTLMGYVLTDEKLTFQKAEEGEGSGNPSEPQPPPSTAQPTHEEPIHNIESSSPQKTQSPRQALNKDNDVERAATTSTSLEAVQDSSNIAKTQSMTTPTEPISQETGSNGGHSSQEDQPEDPLGVLSAAKVLADATRVHTYSRRRRSVSTDNGRVSTASRIVSTTGMIQQVNIIIPLSSATKDKAEKQKMAQVHQAAQGFTEVEWKDIRARVEADEELTHKLQA